MTGDSQNDAAGSAKRSRPSRDLRHELIDAAMRILREEGLERLTLRGVAARVGVSHAAPAHHFRGLPHLLGSLCGIGFEELSDAMERAAHRAGVDPRDRLIAVCEAYVDYALANPGLIELMFNAGKERVEKAAFGGSGQRAYAMLKEVCAPFEPVSAAEDSLETHIWSLIHGFAFLSMGGRFDNPGRTTAQPGIRDVIPHLPLRKA